MMNKNQNNRVSEKFRRTPMFFIDGITDSYPSRGLIAFNT